VTLSGGTRVPATPPPGGWDAAGDELVELVRQLIRIPSVVPVAPGGDGETRVARHIAASLADVGVPSEVLEPVPGRGSVVARLHGEDPDLAPMLLLSHLDVVPVTPDWVHDPFGADLEDGWIYGRGAVDMKGMAAMELAVMRLLAREANAAGRDPASDPIPGLRRGVVLASTADEELGGLMGAGWIAANRPELLRAAGAVNECGGVSVTAAGTTLYPVQVAEKGVAIYRITVHGEPGHGSMPREANAAVRAAAVVTRLAVPGPVRLTATVERFLADAAAALPAPSAELLRLLATDPARAEPIIARTCDPTWARLLRAIVRDTTSPNVIHAGIKGNVIPGVATLEVDMRPLPGMTEATTRAELEARIGPELMAWCRVELDWFGAPVESSADTDLFRVIADTVRAHDPGAAVVPMMAPFSTDAKHTAGTLGVPTYGFSPLKVPADEPFLDRFHGVDERVSVAALHWGLPVLTEVVRRFCA
jgi:acetylornithine deacetylase/succinyl-diaminopimelate desuccinylase-like protein